MGPGRKDRSGRSPECHPGRKDWPVSLLGRQEVVLDVQIGLDCRQAVDLDGKVGLECRQKVDPDVKIDPEGLYKYNIINNII